MYWLRQPPYLRWVAAGLVLLAGVYVDTRPANVVSYPFAANPIEIGQAVDAEVEWLDAPAGILPEWSTQVTGFATSDIAAGTPLLPDLVTPATAPDDWWTVALPLPHRVVPGTPIRVALGDSVVEGVAVGEAVDSGFELVGSVAFPAEYAAQVATASRNSALVVMIGADSRITRSGG